MILSLIIACEVGFWIAIVAGLVARYVFQLKTVSALLLLCAPLIDVVLLVTVTMHLASGATASWHHGLAAIYIGFSLAYGHRMISWADIRFAHRFAGGPAPQRLTGWQYTRRCWGDVGRTLGAALIAAGIIALITWSLDDSDRTAALSGWIHLLGIAIAIEVIWALSYTIWPRKAALRSGRTTTSG